jgi:hypothetical protein
VQRAVRVPTRDCQVLSSPWLGSPSGLGVGVVNRTRSEGDYVWGPESTDPRYFAGSVARIGALRLVIMRRLAGFLFWVIRFLVI